MVTWCSDFKGIIVLYYCWCCSHKTTIWRI